MATTTHQLTWEEFERLPDDGMHHELIEGEHQILPPPKSKHSIIADNVSRALRPLEKLGRVMWEAGYKLADDPRTWIEPDVSFLNTQRILATDPDGYFIGSPDLAVEIISPSESARHIERKIALLLAGGSTAVWVIYPDSRSVHVHTPDRKSVALGEGDALTLPQLLPGWSLTIAQIFA